MADIFIVTVGSEEYGTEDFVYDTEQEALEGYERLKKECRKGTKQDKIERTITLVKDRYITD